MKDLKTLNESYDYWRSHFMTINEATEFLGLTSPRYMRSLRGKNAYGLLNNSLVKDGTIFILKSALEKAKEVRNG
jgi:hypothetical protein